MPEQPRERAVPCSNCRRDTWNLSAKCDYCTKRSFEKILQAEIEKIR